MLICASRLIRNFAYETPSYLFPCHILRNLLAWRQNLSRVCTAKPSAGIIKINFFNITKAPLPQTFYWLYTITPKVFHFPPLNEPILMTSETINIRFFNTDTKVNNI